MKKIIITEIICIIACYFPINYFYKESIKLEKNNYQLYENFESNNLLDASGKINLSEIKSQKQEIEQELNTTFNTDKINIETINNILNNQETTNQEISEEINNLTTQIEELNNKIESLNNQYNTLNTKYNQILAAIKAEEERKLRESTVIINNFPTINQYPNYPTGCESVAITLLLRYYGINVSPTDVINKLKKTSLPYSENGVTYGGNPEVEFIGNPFSYGGYGVFENPIANVAVQYKGGINIRNNFPFSEVINLVKNKRPVMVWTSMGLSLPYISSSWIYKPTGETIYWKANEHAVVVIGYNNNQVIISDPIGGTIKYQTRTTFESRYNYYGRKALYY